MYKKIKNWIKNRKNKMSNVQVTNQMGEAGGVFVNDTTAVEIGVYNSFTFLEDTVFDGIVTPNFSNISNITGKTFSAGENLLLDGVKGFRLGSGSLIAYKEVGSNDNPTLTYDDWTELYWPNETDQGIIGRTVGVVDGDNDFVKNRDEYAFGMNPLSGATSGVSISGETLIAPGLIATLSGEIAYSVRAGIEKLGYGVYPEGSEDLSTYYPLTGNLRRTDSKNGIDLYFVDNSYTFTRLRITDPS